MLFLAQKCCAQKCENDPCVIMHATTMPVSDEAKSFKFMMIDVEV